MHAAALTPIRPPYGGTHEPVRIESDIVETLGQVPDFFASMPDETLEREWAEWKTFQLGDTALTAREKHLIGLGVAAATHCPYCTYFHRAAAGMMGATDAQLEEAAASPATPPSTAPTCTACRIESTSSRSRPTRSASTSTRRPRSRRKAA